MALKREKNDVTASPPGGDSFGKLRQQRRNYNAMPVVRSKKRGAPSWRTWALVGAFLIACHVSRPDRSTLTSSRSKKSSAWQAFKNEASGYFSSWKSNKKKDFSGRYVQDWFVASYAVSKKNARLLGVLGQWHRIPNSVGEVWGPGEDILFLCFLHCVSLYLFNYHIMTFFKIHGPHLGNPLSLILAPFATRSAIELISSLTTLISVGTDVQDIAGRAGFAGLYLTSCVSATSVFLASKSAGVGGGQHSGAFDAGLPLMSMLAYIAMVDPWRRYTLMGMPMNAPTMLAAHALLAVFLRGGEPLRSPYFLILRVTAAAAGAAFYLYQNDLLFL